MTTKQTVGSFLTNGAPMVPLTMVKFIKDFVADALITAAASLSVAQVMDLGGALQAPEVAGIAVGTAVIKAAYRAVLRWATTE